MEIINLTDTNFDACISNVSLPIMVDFYATWCGPCRALSLFIGKIYKECDGKLTIAKCDVEQASNIVEKYNICNLSCVIFFNNGKEFDRIVGFNQVKTREIIDSILSNKLKFI